MNQDMLDLVNTLLDRLWGLELELQDALVRNDAAIEALKNGLALEIRRARLSATNASPGLKP